MTSFSTSDPTSAGTHAGGGTRRHLQLVHQKHRRAALAENANHRAELVGNTIDDRRHRLGIE